METEETPTTPPLQLPSGAVLTLATCIDQTTMALVALLVTCRPKPLVSDTFMVRTVEGIRQVPPAPTCHTTASMAGRKLGRQGLTFLAVAHAALPDPTNVARPSVAALIVLGSPTQEGISPCKVLGRQRQEKPSSTPIGLCIRLIFRPSMGLRPCSYTVLTKT